MTTERRWIAEARRHIGVTEIYGVMHNPAILQFWKDCKLGGIKDDETPWCAAFVGACLERCGIRSTRSDSSRSYLKWGNELKAPRYGCIAVFSRNGGGHVGFVVGIATNGDLLILGGNQSDAVNIRSFPRSRALSFRWPEGEPISPWPLPVLNAKASTSEA